MVSKQAKMFHLKLYSGAPHKMQKERCIVQITHTWASYPGMQILQQLSNIWSPIAIVATAQLWLSAACSQ